jgi:hypothetical protein
MEKLSAAESKLSVELIGNELYSLNTCSPLLILNIYLKYLFTKRT